jgi:hypothetical protein
MRVGRAGEPGAAVQRREEASMATFIGAWIGAILKLSLFALLLYFLAVRPVIGPGYGVWYALIYFFVVCPCVAKLVVMRLLKRRREKDAAARSPSPQAGKEEPIGR